MGKSIIFYCDGGARGNPGPAASAFAVFENHRQIDHETKYIGKTTNNIAEYNAVIMAFNWLIKNKSQIKGKVIFNLDSELVNRQLKGEYKVKSKNLKPLVIKIKSLEKIFSGQVVYRWTPRGKNRIVDKLVNEKLDEKI